MPLQSGPGKTHQLEWPLSATQVEHLDDMLRSLFTRILSLTDAALHPDISVLRGVVVGDVLYGSAVDTVSGLPIGAASTVLTSTGTLPAWALLANANIDPAAAIAYSKLNLTGSIVNADISGAAAIAWSKIDKAGSSLADLTTRSASDLSSGTLAAARGGTGIGAYTVGDLLYASGAAALSALADVAPGSVLAAGGVATAPVWSSSPTIATKVTVGSALALGTTSTDGVIVINSTPATNGVPIQISPRVRLAGAAYNSVSALSETDAFYFEVRPGNAAGATSADLVVYSSLNGAAGVERLRIGSEGSVASNMNQPGQVFWRVGNSHTGAASFANLGIANAVSGCDLYKLGSGFTTSGQYIQNSTLMEDNGTAGLSLSATGGILSFYTNNALRAKFENAGAFNLLTSLSLNSKLAVSATAPTFTSGFGGSTGRSLSGTAFSFTITCGSSSVGATGVLAMPTATTGWTIHAVNLTAAGTPLPYAILQTATTTTSVSVVQIDMSDAAGRAVNFAAGDVLQCIAVAY